MKKKEAMLLIFLVVIVAGLVSISYNYFFVLEVNEIDFQVNVENRLGFNVDTDKLYFGTTYPGGVGKREVFIENYDYPKVRVNIKVYGDINEWVSVDANHFVLEQGESKSVIFYVNVPKDAEYQNYEGKIKIIFTKF